MNTKTSEARTRRLAASTGFVVRNSRTRIDGIRNFGRFMLVDARTNVVALRSRYDATLAELSDRVSRGRPERHQGLPWCDRRFRT